MNRSFPYPGALVQADAIYVRVPILGETGTNKIRTGKKPIYVPEMTTCVT